MKTDFIILPFEGFKEKIRKQKELNQEMMKKHGKDNYSLCVYENCVVAEFKSVNQFF